MHRIVAEKIPEITEICRTHRVKTLELFGSAAGEGFDPGTSDLDFVVEFEAMALAEHADAYLDLARDLEALFARPVDVVEMAPIKNPYFRKAVEESRVPLYAAP
ncbi:hypothetical protein E2N92_05375 [Methanofollis formosanus]|uniref:protein adenylyltransferase n=1 Tax=Methanofollis formosanus TaxID=299308 RepID=A0A8G1A1N0_9EURY|nr:nucleotidyltransferase domain-containing protein [Methanofollis formosanus]QYZ78895.1 hypothetical protein E2N92_05375 [Methanofollis formosanus]